MQKTNKPSFKIIKAKHNSGQEEMYCYWFECPHCGEENIGENYKFCPDCGVRIIWSKEALQSCE